MTDADAEVSKEVNKFAPPASVEVDAPINESAMVPGAENRARSAAEVGPVNDVIKSANKLLWVRPDAPPKSIFPSKADRSSDVLAVGVVTRRVEALGLVSVKLADNVVEIVLAAVPRFSTPTLPST